MGDAGATPGGLPSTGAGPQDGVHVPMGSPTPRPEPDGGAQFVHDMVSTDPSTGATTGPTTGTAALRDLMLPGADAYMRDIEARVAAKNGGRGPANLRFNRAGVA